MAATTALTNDYSRVTSIRSSSLYSSFPTYSMKGFTPFSGMYLPTPRIKKL
jgi:hypothetical protein